MTRMICLRASSDCKRLTKHENTGLGWVIAASRSVCDTPGNTPAIVPGETFHISTSEPGLLSGTFTEAYRLIRPFIANLQEQGYDSYLLDTELYERNPCYRDIRLGYGRCKCWSWSDLVKKARSEVMTLMQEIERFLPNEQKRS